MEQRLIDANDQVLWRLSVVVPDGNRYVPWEVIAEVPTVETVRHGRWNQVETPKWTDNGPVWVCSECGRMMYAAWLFGRKIADFCPYCGAKMDGGAGNAN